MRKKKRKPKYLNKNAQVLLAILLVLFLASWPYFCLVALVALMVGLAIGKVELTREELIIGLVGFF